MKLVAGTLARLAKVNTFLRFSMWMLCIFHNLRTYFHVVFATQYLTKMFLSVSRSLPQIGQRTECRLIPLWSKLIIVANLWFVILQEVILTWLTQCKFVHSAFPIFLLICDMEGSYTKSIHVFIQNNQLIIKILLKSSLTYTNITPRLSYTNNLTLMCIFILLCKRK